MKRLIFLILLTAPFCLQAQWSDPPTMEQTPDTVANLGARKDLRQLVNWNAMRNQLDREDIDTLEYTVGDSATVTFRIVPSSNPPDSVYEGSMYYDIEDDSLYVCVISGSDTTWVGLNGAGGGGGGGGGAAGDVHVQGSPIDNQVAIWVNDTTIEGDVDIIFDGDNLTVDGNVTGDGFIIGSANINETELEIIDGATLTTTELNYVDGVTSAIQDQLDAITDDLEDTISMPLTLWVFSFTDSAQMVDEKTYFTFWWAGPDSVDVDSTVAFSLSASPDFDFNIQFSQTNDASGSWTDMFNTAPTVNGSDAISTGEVDTPNNNAIPPRRWVRLIIKETTDNPTNGATITVCGKLF